jgi:hypothetical protein
VFQERFLAPRCLHLGAIQVAWDCRTGFSCETLPNGYEVGTMTVPELYTQWIECNDTYLSALWFSIVNGYSRRQLTFARDKLVAIAGLSGTFAKIFNTKYLAGMWEKDLVCQLVWRAATTKLKPRPKEYQAPTWSWASINLGVYLDHTVRWVDSKAWRSFVIVDEVAVTPTMDVFGQVESGRLRLRCQIAQWGSIIRTPHHLLMNLDANGPVGERSTIYPDICTENVSDYLLFLPVLEAFGPDWDHELWGLLLEKSKLNPYAFSKVGVFMIMINEDGSIRLSSIPARLIALVTLTMIWVRASMKMGKNNLS